MKGKYNFMPRTEPKILAVSYSAGTALTVVVAIAMLACNSIFFNPLATKVINSFPKDLNRVIFPSIGSNTSYYQRIESSSINTSTTKRLTTTTATQKYTGISTLVTTKSSYLITSSTRSGSSTTNNGQTVKSTEGSTTKIFTSTTNKPVSITTQRSTEVLTTKSPIVTTMQKTNNPISITTQRPTEKSTTKSSITMTNRQITTSTVQNTRNIVTASNKATTKRGNSGRNKRQINNVGTSSPPSKEGSKNIQIILSLELTRDLLIIILVFNIFYLILCILLYFGAVKKGRFLNLMALWIIVEIIRQLAVFVIFGFVFWGSCLALMNLSRFFDIAIPLIVPTIMLIFMVLTFYFWFLVMTTWRNEKKKPNVDQNVARETESIPNDFVESNMANGKNVKWAWTVETEKIKAMSP